jgi:hypothetical protein
VVRCRDAVGRLLLDGCELGGISDSFVLDPFCWLEVGHWKENGNLDTYLKSLVFFHISCSQNALPGVDTRNSNHCCAECFLFKVVLLTPLVSSVANNHLNTCSVIQSVLKSGGYIRQMSRPCCIPHLSFFFLIFFSDILKHFALAAYPEGSLNAGIMARFKEGSELLCCFSLSV